ncbi:MAG: leucine-rich repeat domain-containing protein, partial [Paludibacteraceae bacterium]|nr:leucine-rich repeat domain-containing protein [Paludibacteraceae bacterium]
YMLKSLDIPASIKRIGNWSFAYCEYTKEIKIPSGLESIGSYAFYGCYALTEMSLPSSVTSIEDYAFQNCKNLDLVIDNSEENITLGDGVFDNCKSVKYLK